MTAFWVWFHDHRNLRRRVRTLTRELTIARSSLAAVQHLIRCTDPLMHVRLAHQLHVAQTRLAQIEEVEPHAASLVPLVREDID